MVERRQPRTVQNLKNLPEKRPETLRREQLVIMLEHSNIPHEEIAKAVERPIRWVKDTLTKLRQEGRL